MKLVTRSLIGGALLMLMAPMAAQARDCHFHHSYWGWRHHDIFRDRRDLRADWRDVAHDRQRLRWDIANGDWYAARAQRADITRDLGDIRGDRRDLYHDYRAQPWQRYYFDR